MGSTPTWATSTTTSSWSSQECSPPCHAGDRGFKSHRGRSRHGTVRQPGRAAKLKPWCLWVRLPPVLLEQHASVGHWQAPLAVTQTSTRSTLRTVQFRPDALSTWPVRLVRQDVETLNLAADGTCGAVRVRASHTGHSRRSGGTGRHATLRLSCPRGVGVRLSPSSLIAGLAGA